MVQRIALSVMLCLSLAVGSLMGVARAAPIAGGAFVERNQAAQVLADDCDLESDAVEELRARAMASLKMVELLRDLQTELDNAYEATREASFWDAAVDVASLAAGWPLGKGISEALLGKASQTLTENLIKAGFKGIEKRLLKDPSLGGVYDQLTTLSLTSGTASDVGMEAAKQGLKQAVGDSIGESTFFIFSFVKTGASVYQGMGRLEALRHMISDVGDQIIDVDTRHGEEVDLLTDAMSALGICENAVRLGLDPGKYRDGYSWRKVAEYLGIDPGISVVSTTGGDDVPPVRPPEDVPPRPEPTSTPTPRPAGPPTPTPTPRSTCSGDEQMRFVPFNPRVGDEVNVQVTSSKPLTNISLEGGAALADISSGSGGYIWTFKFRADQTGRRDFTFRVGGQACTANGITVSAASTPVPPTQYYVFVLNGIGFYIGTEDYVKSTPSCRFAGGGLCPPNNPPTVAGRYSGPFPTIDAAKKDLKTKLECQSGYWGPQGLYGGKWYWLQNNVGTGDCKSVKQL